MTELTAPQNTTRDSALEDLVGRIMDAAEALLRTHPEGMSELAMLRTLQDDPWRLLASIDFSSPTALYPVHFLLFHSLYRQRERLVAESGETIDISALNIRIRPTPDRGLQEAGQHDALHAFYRDIANHDLGETTINRMLDDFWQGITRPADEDLRLACDTLAIDRPPPDLNTARNAFRRLAMRHHPDRGGSNEQLQALNRAMATVRHHFRGYS
ncbi:DNA-J related domain-containing protein [Salicola sp. Rm-C-2C1-2]|uniref:DNA-J related domain-containing protein n=1 Tax=Salicola sp. Rm-C-2C1-2 TaxID=3141321 RepID=UPI0032E42B08